MISSAALVDAAREIIAEIHSRGASHLESDLFVTGQNVLIAFRAFTLPVIKGFAAYVSCYPVPAGSQFPAMDNTDSECAKTEQRQGTGFWTTRRARDGKMIKREVVSRSEVLKTY